MSQQSDMAESLYAEMRQHPVALSDVVNRLQEKWGEDLGIHGFAREVATCLLNYNDVEVGDFANGRFDSWGLDPWDANDKIDRELMAMDRLLEDESRYVFRIKQKTEQRLDEKAARATRD